MTEFGKPLDFLGMSKAGMAIQQKAFEIAQINSQLLLEYVNGVVKCRNPGEVAKVTQDFTTKQLEEFKNQAKQLMEIATNKGGS